MMTQDFTIEDVVSNKKGTLRIDIRGTLPTTKKGLLKAPQTIELLIHKYNPDFEDFDAFTAIYSMTEMDVLRNENTNENVPKINGFFRLWIEVLVQDRVRMGNHRIRRAKEKSSE